MKCPICHEKAHATDSRWIPTKNQTWRRWQCNKCSFRFTTLESYAKDYNAPKAFIKRRLKI